MADIIVTIILVVLIGGAVTYIVKAKKSGVKLHWMSGGRKLSGQRESCRRKKLDGPVAGRKTMQISGMNCAHCAMDVTRALNQIDGVRAEVNLAKGRARITFDREIDDAELISAVETAGFQVESIKP